MLNEITKWFHSYDDYLQFRLVCKQWNLKLPKIPNANKVPWLLSPIAIDASETRDLEEKGIYHFMLPDMLQDNIILGSCYGWLISVESHEDTVQILNPFTKVHLDNLLPPVSTLPNVIGNDGTQYILSEFFRPQDHSFIHRFQFGKIIINSAPNNDNKDLTAVAIYGCGSQLIYAVDMYGQLYEFDSKTKPESMGGIHEAPPPSDVGKSWWDNRLKEKYLVGCANNGSLLMLVRHYNPLKDEEKGRVLRLTNLIFMN
ncbi:hypothetical protein PIB30_081543 [Stylosanthes scabra]|uniref:KIB1-4 beta-propeller domain-containing protein n=1 Tax=Stylosanthes scabra TaxID=79078 RepID=A0ABU6SRZ4_9FABA|nr:hypothetical protein [Stylosanthes scabra]